MSLTRSQRSQHLLRNENESVLIRSPWCHYGARTRDKCLRSCRTNLGSFWPPTDKMASWADAGHGRFQVRSNGSPGQVGQVKFGQVRTRTRSLVQAEKLWVGSVTLGVGSPLSCGSNIMVIHSSSKEPNFQFFVLVNLILQRYNFSACTHTYHLRVMTSPFIELEWIGQGKEYDIAKIPEHVWSQKTTIENAQCFILEQTVSSAEKSDGRILKTECEGSTETLLPTQRFKDIFLRICSSYRTLFFSLQSVLNVILWNLRGWIHVQTNWGYRPECHW